MGDATSAAIARAVKHNSSLQNLEIDTYYSQMDDEFWLEVFASKRH